MNKSKVHFHKTEVICLNVILVLKYIIVFINILKISLQIFISVLTLLECCHIYIILVNNVSSYNFYGLVNNNNPDMSNYNDANKAVEYYLSLPFPSGLQASEVISFPVFSLGSKLHTR